MWLDCFRLLDPAYLNPLLRIRGHFARMALASGWDAEEFGAPPDALEDEDCILVDDRSLEDLPEAAHEDAYIDEVQSTPDISATWQQQVLRPPPTSAPSYAHWNRPRFLPSEQPRRAESSVKPTSIVGRDFAHVFPYESFNAMQSECFDILFKRDANVVVTGTKEHRSTLIYTSAPTGSGKTVLFELALCRLFAAKSSAETASSRKALYLAPLKVQMNDGVD